MAGALVKSLGVLGFGLSSLVLLVLGCSPPPPPAAPSSPPAAEAAQEEAGLAVLDGAPAAEAEPAAEAQPAPTEAPAATADDGLDADIAALSESTQSGEAAATSKAAAPASEGDKSSREVVYRVTPKGLVIEIDGIHLRPEAKPFKDKTGAYGIELVVNAESFDGRQYWVSQPKAGPLSIAGKIEASAGKVSRFADERNGGTEEPVLGGAPRRFVQRWPGRGQPKLWAGQTVTLEVGLWGVRAETERERPVRRLFVVKMVAGNKSPAVITPPTMDWGS